MYKNILIFITLATITGILLFTFPGIDLWVSAQFYSPEKGFYLNKNPFLLVIYYSVYITFAVLAAGFPALIALNYFYKKQYFGLSDRKILYLLAVLLIGPGLLVHTVFKDTWDRARPLQIEEFGKDKKFSPAFVISDQCESNCSFVSGHAAMGFYFLAFALLAGKNQKKWLAGTTLLGVIVGGARILQGSHFLSDVIFAGVLVFLTAWLLHLFFFPKKPNKKKRRT